MKWDIKRSEELKKRIAEDEKLTRSLSNSVDEILKKYRIELKNMSYVFEPRVFTMSPDEAPEVMIKSSEAMLIELIQDSYKRGFTAKDILGTWNELLWLCLPECGGMDPLTLRKLEKFRILDVISDDPIPVVAPSAGLIKKIVGNRELLTDFSESIFGILEKHGITFKENEGCVFTPVVFETPIFAQKVAVAERTQQIRGFGPQVYADPTPEPAVRAKLRPLPGIIVAPWGPTVGIIWPPWWWIGIPAPEMLRALDIMREREAAK